MKSCSGNSRECGYFERKKSVLWPFFPPISQFQWNKLCISVIIINFLNDHRRREAGKCELKRFSLRHIFSLSSFPHYFILHFSLAAIPPQLNDTAKYQEIDINLESENETS